MVYYQLSKAKVAQRDKALKQNRMSREMDEMNGENCRMNL